MHGKTQNANESFNGTIWERIPKNTFVTLPNLEFGVYDQLLEKDHTYIPGKIYSSIFRCILCHFNHWLF